MLFGGIAMEQAVNLVSEKKELPFGLRDGQVLGNASLLRETLWYDKAGKFLGRGDVSEENFRRISREIATGELFVIVTRHLQRSLWGCSSEAPVDPYWLARNCTIIIATDAIFLVTDQMQKGSRAKFGTGFLVSTIEKKDAQILILGEAQVP